MRYFAFLLLAACSVVQAKTAEEAWNGLLSENFKKREAFAFVENISGLPNVLIYGDSISIAYTPTVRDSLKGVANVYRLHVNGGDSSSVIQKMDTMQEAMEDHWDFKWDVIHFNVGLHDLKYIKDGKLDREKGKQVSSQSAYEENLRKR